MSLCLVKGAIKGVWGSKATLFLGIGLYVRLPREVRQPRQLPWLEFLTNGKIYQENATNAFRKETDVNQCLNFPKAGFGGIYLRNLMREVT